MGAGPGDAKLLTVRAVELLKRADVVLCDYLVDPAALEHASASAELVRLGHHSTGREFAAGEIVARMVEEARRGRTVVRLKGGDPSVFGRGADEIEALRDAEVPFEVVPGVTTGLAVGAFCEIPITHHDDASAVALVAGQQRHDKAACPMDYGALAEFPGTLIFYMGVTKAAQWSQALIDRGKPADTPVAIVRRCAWARQQTIRCTLASVADVVGKRRLRPPAVFVVGKVVDRAPQLSWFAARPLFGLRVLLPGPPDTAGKLRDRLAELGADVIAQPVVRITDPPDWAPVDSAMGRLGHYDWLVFASVHGVECFFRRLFDRGGDARRLGRVKVAALSLGAAARLTCYGLRADLAPGDISAGPPRDNLARGAHGRRFLLARTGRSRWPLARQLEKAGARVDQIAVCGWGEVESPDPEVARALSAGQIDWIAAPSAAAARALIRLYGQAVGGAKLASIGPSTSTALRELGIEPAAEASGRAGAGLVEAILRFGRGEG